MTTQEIINALVESTPLYADLAGLVAEYAKPYKFEVNGYYRNIYKSQHYIIEKRTKRFVYYIETSRFINKPTPERYLLKKKIKYDDEGNEYIDLGKQYYMSYHRPKVQINISSKDKRKNIKDFFK